MTCPAFAVRTHLNLRGGLSHHGFAVSRRRPRSRRYVPARMALEKSGKSDPEEDSEERPNLFVDEEARAFWDDLDVAKTFGAITEEEKAALREKLPPRVAQFLIRRAEDAVDQRDGRRSEETLIGRLLKDVPSDVIDWEDEENREYKDYLYDTRAGPPSFRRKGSSLFGGGDGLPDVEDVSNVYKHSIDGEDEEEPPKSVMSLFVGNPNSIDERASQVGYSFLVLFGALILFKVLISLISFFVSFTFSFVAIFALSAGIFVVFFFLRF